MRIGCICSELISQIALAKQEEKEEQYQWLDKLVVTKGKLVVEEDYDELRENYLECLKCAKNVAKDAVVQSELLTEEEKATKLASLENDFFYAEGQIIWMIDAIRDIEYNKTNVKLEQQNLGPLSYEAFLNYAGQLFLRCSKFVLFENEILGV